MTRRLRSSSLLQNLTPFLQPTALSSLLAIAGAGLACSGTDAPVTGGAGQGQTTAGSAPVAG
ncbi:MAG TPA: hypothetical protein VJV79_11655, partial [Polyangiaceae bacterium]|nr:hypothetical protein [Polyangiaceae bacterium]